MGKKKKKIQSSSIDQATLLIRTDVWAVIALLMLTLIFFWKAVLLKGVFITGDLTTSDLTNLNYPVRHFLSECLKTGTFPLWTPYIYNGFPLLAEGEMGGFYPLNLLFFSVLPMYIAYNYSIILNFFLSGFFLFMFARSIGLSTWAGFISGFSFAFCGFFVTHLKHLNMIQAAMWLPLLFFLTELFFKKKRFLYPVLAGLVFGAQILAGHFQIAYYAFLGMSVYFIYRVVYWYYLWWQEIRTLQKQKMYKEANNKKNGWKKPLAKYILAFFLIGSIGSGIAAVQLLPTYEFTQLATRAGGLSYEDTTSWGYHPDNLRTLIFPYLYGDYAKGEFPFEIGGERTLFWENCGYVGFLTLILGLLGIVVGFSGKCFQKSQNLKPEFRFWAIFFFLSLLLVLGKYTPLFKLFWDYLPGLNYFRFPNRFLLFTSISLCLLAGFGMDFLLTKAKTQQIRMFLIVGLIIVVIIDIFAFGFTHNPTISPEIWLSKPRTVEFLEKDKSLFRVYNFGCDESWRMVYSMSKGWKGDLTKYVKHREVLQPNLNMTYHISSSEGYPAFAPVRLNNLHNFFRNIDNVKLYKQSQDDPLGFAVPEPQFTKLLGILNVKYILSLWGMRSNQLEEVKYKATESQDMPITKIYKNKEVIPRVYLVPKAKMLKEQDVLPELIKKEHDPMQEVIIEENLEIQNSCSIEGSQVKVTKYLPLEVQIEANLTDNGWLVLADTYYPGWKAYLDGKETKIYLANYIQRAIKLEKGKHSVCFVYQPISFKIGFWLSLIILLGVISILVVFWVGAIRKLPLTITKN